MDNLIIASKPPKNPKYQYAHVRCNVMNFAEIERIAHACNLNNREVTDMLLSFALKRVKLIERPLYELGFQELGSNDAAEAEDENEAN